MASIIVPLMPGRKNLVERQWRHGLAQVVEVREDLRYLFLPPGVLGHEPCDWPSMAGDDDRLAALDVAEEAEQVGLGLGSRDFAHFEKLA
jgi:hypothetical protein